MTPDTRDDRGAPQQDLTTGRGPRGHGFRWAMDGARLGIRCSTSAGLAVAAGMGCPEINYADLTMVGDRIDDTRPSRTWHDVVDRATFERFANAWRLHDATGRLEVCESHGDNRQPARSFVFDDLNWYTDGEPPIIRVGLQILGVTGAVGNSGRRSAEF